MIAQLQQIIKTTWPDCPHYIKSRIKLDAMMSALHKRPVIDLVEFDEDILPKLLPGYDPQACSYKDKKGFSMADACK